MPTDYVHELERIDRRLEDTEPRRLRLMLKAEHVQLQLEQLDPTKRRLLKRREFLLRKLSAEGAPGGNDDRGLKRKVRAEGRG